MPLCPDLASTNLEKSSQPKTIQIGQLDAYVFSILICVSRPIENMFFRKVAHIYSHVATNSLRYTAPTLYIVHCRCPNRKFRYLEFPLPAD